MPEWVEDPEGYEERADTFSAIIRLKNEHRYKQWDSDSLIRLNSLLDKYEALGGLVERSPNTFPISLNSPSLWIPQKQ